MTNCKICGGFINPNDKVCPFCGNQIINKDNVGSSGSYQEIEVNSNPIKPGVNNNNKYPYDIFSLNNWRSTWANICDGSGIILFNSYNLKNKTLFLNELNSYIEFRKKLGYDYYSLDLATQKILDIYKVDVENIIKILRIIYDVKVPKYLLIIGDDIAIPRINYSNPLWNPKEPYNEDKFVVSDFPYISLSMNSPWKGIKFNLDKITMVGRIPASEENNYEEAIVYFNNIKKFKIKPKANIKSFVVTYQPKKIDSAKKVYDQLKPVYYMTPYYLAEAHKSFPDAKRIPRPNNYDMINFALHGSSSNHKYSGEFNGKYPYAFTSNFLPDETNTGYVIMCQACYGAKSKISSANKDSILLNALKNNCLGFVGSTGIGYSGRFGSIGSTDILAREFVGNVYNGKSLGYAYRSAIAELYKTSNHEIGIKCMVEIALYGDPSLKFIDDGSKDFDFEITKSCDFKEDNSIDFRFISLDDDLNSKAFNGNIKYKGNNDITQIKKAISNDTDLFMKKNIQGYDNVKPTIFKLANSNEYRSIYTKIIDDVISAVRINLDENGNVIDVFESD